MSRPTGTHPARAAGALLLVAALVAAVPAGLARLTRQRFGSWSPLAGVAPPWHWRAARVADALREPLADDTVVDVVVRVCLITVWTVLAVLVVTIVVELTHQIRQRGMPAPHVRGLGGAQRVARWVVGGLLVALPIGSASATSPHPGQSALLLLHAERPASHVVTAATVEHQRPSASADGHGATGPALGVRAPAAPAPGTAGPTDGGDVVHVVRPGESVYSIAAQLAGGDPQLTVTIADAVLDANLGRTMTGGRTFTNPAYIEVGWRLVLPAPWASGAGDGLLGRTTAPTDVHVVAAGDTLAAIAAEALGDPAAWPAIWEANAGREMADGRRFEDPDLIVPGWRLRLPGPGDGDAPRPPTATDHPSPGLDDADAPGPPAANGRPSPGLDHADAPGPPTANDRPSPELGDADPPPQPPATHDPGAGPGDADAPRRPTPTDREDPTPTAPRTGTTPSAAPTPTAPDPTSSAAATSPTTDTATAPEPVAPGGSATTVGAGEPRRADGPAAPLPTASTTTTLPDAPGEPTGAAGGAGATGVPDAGSPIRLEHAAFLAAGVLALVAVRRRQRMRAARGPVRIPDPAPDVAALERSLRIADPGERALRVDVAVRAVAAELLHPTRSGDRSAAVDHDGPLAHRAPGPDGPDARIGIVLVADDGAITVHLTAPSSLPTPWHGAGTTWQLRAAVPVELLADAARRVGAPCVALVHVGRSGDGREVLVDLEAAGELVVEAPGPVANEVVAAIAATTATSEHAEIAHLVGVSLPPEAFVGHPNVHHVDSADAAVELATSLAGATARQERTTFDLRARRTGGDVWEPVLVFATTDDLFLDVAASRLPEPGHGVAVVAGVTPGAVPGDRGGRLRRDDDHWTLTLCGERIAMTPVGITEQDLGRLADLVASAAGPLPDTDATADTRPAGGADGSPSGREPGPTDTAPPEPPSTVVPPRFTPTPHRILVRLLGSVDVVDGDGRAAEFERSKAVELIAWLATHRDRATRTGARTALWELDVRDATFANVVSEARRSMARLVDPPDGHEWLARTLNESLPLHAAVVTDADLVAERVAHAEAEPPERAIATLRPALELIRDLPFSGTNYLWPDAEGISSRLVLSCTTACSRLAAHALSVGDLDLVFEATDRGRRVLPGHEELIGLRMRAHARTGDLAGVRHEWEAYERVVVADAWSDGEPAPKLAALRRELLMPGPA